MSSNYTEVFAWGNDKHGQLGFGGKHTNSTYNIPRFCSFNVLIKQMSCGEHHSAFIADNGYVYSMGSNSKGLLGIGDKTVIHSPSPVLVEGLAGSQAVQVSCGWTMTAAVMADGSLFTWGSGAALGITRDTVAWEPVSVPISNKPLEVSCGAKHMAVIATDSCGKRKLMTCGENESGQLALGHVDVETKLKRVKIKENIKSAASGVFHTLIVTTTGKVYSAGGNNYGQLGIGSNKGSAVPVQLSALSNYWIKKAAAGSFSTALSDRGDVFVWGTGAFGEFLSPQRVVSLSTAVKDIAMGKSFSAALDVKGMLWCWGQNNSGELGVGDSNSRINPYPITHLQSKKITSIACGGSFAIALGNDVGKTTVLSPQVSTRRHMYDLPVSNRSESLPPMLSPKTQNQFESIKDEIFSLQSGKGELERVYTLLEEVQKRHMSLQKEKQKQDKKVLNMETEIKRCKQQNQSTLRQQEAQVTQEKDGYIQEQNRQIQQLTIKIGELEAQVKAEKDIRIRAESMLMNELSIREALESDLEQQTSANSDREKLESLTQMCNRKSEKITALTQYNETLQSAYATLKAEHAEMTQAMEQEFNLIRELEQTLNEQNPDELEAVKTENAQLKDQLNNVQNDLRHAQKKLEESELKYIFLRDEKENLQLNITEMEGQSRREVENLERAIAEKARNYKEKTQSVLDSSPIRTPAQDWESLNPMSVNNSNIFRLSGLNTPNHPLLASPLNFASSPNLDYTSPAQSARFSELFEDESGRPSLSRHGLLPEHALRISQSASKLLETLGMDSPNQELGTGKFVFIRSPDATSPNSQVQITPPTFRGFENAPQNLLKDSISDMRSKLASLHDNKSALAAKMEEFEKKLKENETDEFV